MSKLYYGMLLWGFSVGLAGLILGQFQSYSLGSASWWALLAFPFGRSSGR